MITFLKGAWKLGCGLLAIVFLISCFTAFIPSSLFSYTVYFALLFPYLFVLIIVAAVINLFINKRWASALFLLLLPGLYNFFHTVAVSPFSSWKMEKDSGNTRIMTWNVSEFVNPAPLGLPDADIRRAILHTITEYNPDILCFQEFYNADSSRDLPSEIHELDSLGYHYHTFAPHQRLKTFYGIIERGVIICSKTPFINTGHIQIRDFFGTENMSYADMLIDNKPVRISTGHLISYYLFPDSARGYVGEKTVAKKLYTYKNDVNTKMRAIDQIHNNQAALLRRFLDTSSYPVVYCGDMNATPAMYTYRLLKGNRQDAFLEKGNGIGATFYNIVPTLRIDVCFPDERFSVSQCTVIHRKLGDHYPVVADIKWKRQ